VKPPVAKAPAAETPVAAKPAIAVAKDKPASAPVPPAAATKAAKTAESKTNTFAGLFTPFILEEKTMDISANFAGFQDAVTEAQAKAKAAFEKSSVAFGEAGDFAKGNVEAVIESGKIFAEGIQGFGSEFVAEGRTAFETFTGDIKELAAAKSPTDFFKLQGDILRKNFDSAVAYGSKNSEAALKLFSDTIAPISGRVSVAVEKARQVAV
jgi:phasin family protein